MMSTIDTQIVICTECGHAEAAHVVDADGWKACVYCVCLHAPRRAQEPEPKLFPVIDRETLLVVGLAMIAVAVLMALMFFTAPRADGQEIALASSLGHELSPRPLPAVPEPHIAAEPTLLRAFVGVERPRSTLRAPYWDKWNRVEAGAAIGLMGADMAQTCRSLARSGGYEANLPSQSCPKLVAMSVGFEAAGLGLSYALHRLGRHRLERIPMAYLAYGSTRGIVYSRQHGAW